MTGIRKEDIVDAEIIDAIELASDGTTVFVDDATVVSTTSSTKTIVLSGINLVYDKEERSEANDIITLAGTSGGGAADGTYTVASITDSTTLVVVEAIADSTGGTADIKHPAGATKVGVDPSSIAFSSNTDVQSVLEDLDSGITTGHKTLEHLIHYMLNGPGGGYGAGPYVSEILPLGSSFPTSETWYKSASKTNKIVRYEVTYNADKTHATEKVIIYKTDGVSPSVDAVDTISYTSKTETGRSRAVTYY